MRNFWKDLWFLLLFVAGGLIVLVLLIPVLAWVIDNATINIHTLQWLQNLMMLLATVLWVMYYKKERVREALYLHWPGWRVMLLTALLMVVSMPAFAWFCELCEAMPLPRGLAEFGHAMQYDQEQVMQLLLDVHGVGGWLALIMLMCVMTGLAEESLFRGALLRCFAAPGQLTRRNVWWIALAVGAIFAAIHVEVFGFIPRTLLGGFFVVLLWRTGSIWPAVLAHAINNCFALVEMKAAPLWLEELGEATWSAPVSAVLAIGAGYWLFGSQRQSLHE